MHPKSCLVIGLLSLVCTPGLAQKPATVLEVMSQRAGPTPRVGQSEPATPLVWENLRFVFAGPDQITREVVTEAQVTVFDYASHEIVFQTNVYRVRGEELEPGPNYTATFHLQLQDLDGQVYDVLVGSGLIELVVPVGNFQELLRSHSRP